MKALPPGPAPIQRPLLATGVALAVIAITGSPAAAGGWWTYLQLEHEQLAVGESTTVSADLLYPSVEHAEDAARSGEYFAYLVRGIDEEGLREAMSRPDPDDDWWTAPDEAIRLAAITLDRGSSNLGSARATFEVPDVEPGIYDLMLCDRGCSRALADVVPRRGIYVGDPVTVAFLRDAELRSQAAIDELGGVRARLDGLQDRTGTISKDVEALDDRLEDLATSLGQLEGVTTSLQRLTAAIASVEAGLAAGAEPVVQPWWTHAGSFVAVAVAAAALALALAWGRTRRRRTAVDEPLDDRRLGEGPDATTASSDGDGPPPELITWELDHGVPVR